MQLFQKLRKQFFFPPFKVIHMRPGYSIPPRGFSFKTYQNEFVQHNPPKNSKDSVLARAMRVLEAQQLDSELWYRIKEKAQVAKFRIVVVAGPPIQYSIYSYIVYDNIAAYGYYQGFSTATDYNDPLFAENETVAFDYPIGTNMEDVISQVASDYQWKNSLTIINPWTYPATAATRSHSDAITEIVNLVRAKYNLKTIIVNSYDDNQSWYDELHANGWTDDDYTGFVVPPNFDIHPITYTLPKNTCCVLQDLRVPDIGQQAGIIPRYGMTGVFYESNTTSTVILDLYFITNAFSIERSKIYSASDVPFPTDPTIAKILTFPAKSLTQIDHTNYNNIPIKMPIATGIENWASEQVRQFNRYFNPYNLGNRWWRRS